MHPLRRLLSLLDIPVLPSRLQLFEWCDLYYVPAIVKHRCQETLTAQWTHKLPFIQAQAPADLAANLIQRVLDNILDIDTEPYTIIDFCSGAGGPTPHIESAVNRRRTAAGQKPVLFRLSDIVPNLDAWMEASSRSEYLSFIPQPVNAAVPPPSVISKTAAETSPHVNDLAHSGHANNKTIHLFCLSFHHFSDDVAKDVLANVLTNSDSFVIIELQDRSLGTLLLLSLEFALLYLVTIFWFWHDISHLLLTYWIPILPFVHTWDGLVSCLRTRTPREMSLLLDQVIKDAEEKRRQELVTDAHPVGRYGGHDLDAWTISTVRQRHTWPFGYLNAFIGIRKDCRRES